VAFGADRPPRLVCWQRSGDRDNFAAGNAAIPTLSWPRSIATRPTSRRVKRSSTVPHSAKSLVAVAPERVRRLREHLVGTLREMRTAKPWVHSVSPALPDPTGFPARVAQTACSLCNGWCCRNGDDNGFLDEPTLARLCIVRPGMTEGAILWLYLARVPPVAYRDSCVFHGKQGCTPDRSLRADICNKYFCGGPTASAGAGSSHLAAAGELLLSALPPGLPPPWSSGPTRRTRRQLCRRPRHLLPTRRHAETAMARMAKRWRASGWR